MTHGAKKGMANAQSRKWDNERYIRATPSAYPMLWLNVLEIALGLPEQWLFIDKRIGYSQSSVMMRELSGLRDRLHVFPGHLKGYQKAKELAEARGAEYESGFRRQLIAPSVYEVHARWHRLPTPTKTILKNILTKG